MKIKWLLMFSIVFLLLLAPAMAAGEITVDTKAVTNVIEYDETARFVLTITNNQEDPDRFLFSSTPSQLGSATLWRFNPQTVDIADGASEDVIFDLTPPKDIQVGTYSLDIIVYSSSDNSIKGYGIIKFEITSEYPRLTASMAMPGELYPGTLPITVIVENDGVEAQENLSAVFESDLFGAYDLEIDALRAGETKLVFNNDVEISSSTEIGRYVAKVVFYKNGEFVNEVKKDITILGKGNLAISHDVDKGLLTTKYSATLTNVGNAVVDEEWSAEFKSWQRIFVDASPKQASIDTTKGLATFVWPVVLSPGETTTLNYQISYSPLLAIIFAMLFLAYVLIWYLGKEFTIKKEAKTKKDHIEVKLTIKNNTAEIKHDVVVEDRIPTPLKLVREFGTKAPTAIKKGAGTMRMIWKFRHLGPFEEVILSYGLKSRLSVVGQINLPAATLKAKIGNSLKRFISNTFVLTGKIAVKEKPDSN